jgi:hypothetical protein
VAPSPQHAAPAQHVSPHACGLDATHWHAPAAQVASAGHVRPQLPQFCASFCASTQRAELPVPQTTSPAAQQRPLAQACPVAQRVPHAPQFCGSLERSTHAVGAPAGHLAGRLVGHAQTPAAQISFTSPHAMSHPPQWPAWVWVFTQASPQVVGSDAGQAHAPPEQT